MGRRVILIVMDSFGVGELPDAASFGDVGVNTIRSCMSSSQFAADHLAELGLFSIDGVKELPYVREYVSSHDLRVTGACARLAEASKGKDTTTGHWEIAGLISAKPFPTYPDGFPKEILDAFSEKTGRGILCNLPYSGTAVINDYGDEHVKTGDLIVYTSADSVFQIAAHEDVVPLEKLYEYCRIARDILQGEHGVGRVIARPFVGENGNYTRTSHRHDFSLVPPGDTMLDLISGAGLDVLAVGKIHDIFAGRGMTEFTYTSGNEEGIDKTVEWMDRDFTGLMFVNLVDYDMLYGHRRDIDGYAKAVAYFDERLHEITEKMRPDDILMITADHGCDPGYTATTDHTREYIPLVMYGSNVSAGNLGTCDTFADISATILQYLNVKNTLAGEPLITVK
ncbi:MAG: phosphopentomutase [Lachnospiraceae bacterium]|nr:phosphopentomutase [Lachnospiraceae bacterium]